MSELIKMDAPCCCHRLRVTDDDVRAVDRDDLLRMLALLYLIRDFETEVLNLKDADLIHGPAHTSIGQEAVAVGVTAALRKGDMVASTHRAHGHFLAKAFMYYAPDNYRPLEDPVTPIMQEAVNKTLAEIMGLKDGWCGGRGGSMHLYDGTSGNLGSNAIVGGGIPLATGAAWAEKLRGRDTVVVSYFGDGAINQGVFHEVANMAALWDVPILYLVENNFYAVGTSTQEASCIEDLGLRTLGYGFDSMIVDGMDPIAMYVAARYIVERMRRSPSPYLLEAKTYRHYHHAGRIAGSAFGYRTKEEEAEWLEKDPAVAFPKKLLALGLVSEAENERLQQLARALMDGALAFCTAEVDGKRVIPAEKWPAPESVVEHVRCERDLFTDVTFQEQEDFSTFKTMSYVEAIAGVTLRNMERDERVIVLGEEVANLRGGAYQATRGIKEVFPERLINTPISETGFVGMSGAPRRLRRRIAIGYGYGGQHSMDPASFFAQFSGWRIMAPSNAFDYIGMFNTAMRFEDPVLMLEHGMLYAEKGQVPADTMDYYVAYGKGKVVREGSDVTVLTYLTGVAKCLQAAEELAAEGISAEVIDLRTLDYIGMDYALIGQSVRKTGSVLIVEQGPRSLTLGARISDEIQERFFDYLDCPIGKVTAPDVPAPVSRKLEEAFIPSLAKIKAAMRQGGQHMF